MKVLGPILSSLGKLGLRGPIVFFFTVISGLLLYLSDSKLSRLHLLELRQTCSLWIEIVFLAAMVLTAGYASERLDKSIRLFARMGRINRRRRKLLNGLNAAEHQILETYFRRDGLRESTLVISNPSIEHDALIRLKRKRIVLFAPTRVDARDWSSATFSVAIAPWAWRIMCSARYKPDLTGIEDSHSYASFSRTDSVA
jgi:hypothetical protein